MMRWKKVAFFIGIPILLIVLFLLFIDNIIEQGIENTGGSIVGAKVEMDGFHISLIKGSTEWKRLQVTNPKNTMKNLFETGDVRFQLNPSALFKKQVLIEELSLLHIAAGTNRSYDGALPERKQKADAKRKPTLFSKMKAKMTEEIESMPILEWQKLAPSNLNVDSLIAAADLLVIPKADSARNLVQEISKKWTSFANTYRPDEDLKRLGDTYRAIEIKDVNTLSELLDLLQTIQTSGTELKAIQDTIQTKSREIQADIKTLEDIRKSLPEWVESDYQKLLTKANLPDLSLKNIGKILFGQAILDRTGMFLDVLDLMQRALPRKDPTTATQTKSRQEEKNTQNKPAFLIQNLALSGHLPIGKDSQQLQLSGKGTGLTTQPWIYQKATTLDLQGASSDGRSVKLTALFDWIENQSHDNLSIHFKRLPLHFKKPDGAKGFIPSIKDGIADVDIQTWFTDNHSRILLDLSTRQLIYYFEKEPQHPLESRLRQILNRHSTLQFGMDIQIQDGRFTMGVQSSIDDLVSKELNRYLSESTLKLQNQIRSQLMNKTSKRRNTLTKDLTDSRHDVQMIQSNYQTQLDDVLEVFNTKKEALTAEIEKREKKEKDKLEGKAKDLLDQLLKKKKKKESNQTTDSM